MEKFDGIRIEIDMAGNDIRIKKVRKDKGEVDEEPQEGLPIECTAIEFLKNFSVIRVKRSNCYVIYDGGVPKMFCY